VPILHFQISGQGQLPNGGLVALAPAVALQQRGPCVQVSISPQENVAQALIQQGGQIPSPVTGAALIDTGASVTFIDAEAAHQVGLPVIDVVSMASATHAGGDRNVYPIQIEIVGTPIRFQAPRAIEAELAGQGLVLLIGRDALQFCTLFYNGPAGELTLSL
jgi:predicted aspartyl protease